MPDLLAQTLALPGFWALVPTIFIAGVVYGFAGFGAALVFMPVASALVPIEVAVAAFAVSATSSFFTVVPRAWGQVNRSGVTVMVVCATLSASLGLWVLRITDLTVLRWAVIAVTATTLLALIAGWRYAAPPTFAARSAIGLATGFVGGATGLLGPVMVLFQLAGRDLSRRRGPRPWCF